MIPKTIFLPNSNTATVNTTPHRPISIPSRIVIPSLLSKPRDIIKIPIPGKKFVRGRGIAIEIENINEKKPITCDPRWELNGKSLAFSNFSIFFRIGEDFWIIVASVVLFIDFLVNHFGSHGESKPINIWTDRNNSGMAKIVVVPGI